MSDWVITSVSRSTPARMSATWSAAVPLTVAIACFAPVYSAIFCSNRSTNSPTLETKVESMVSSKYFFSFPLKFGACRGINSFVP